ncbi:MAG: DinB family protein [Fimbriimonadaceae bacterium]
MDLAIWEMSEAFDGFPAADLWVRPHPHLLSVGELAVHVAYSEMRWLHPELESPLNQPRAGYYSDSVDEPLELPLGPTELYDKVQRVHEACRARIQGMQPNFNTKLPSRDDWSWGDTLQYMAFPIACHTGQMYSARHLMGHEPANY